MNLRERISDKLVKNLDSAVNRVNDNLLAGFHLRTGHFNGAGIRRISYYFYYRIGGRNGRQVNFLIGRDDTLSAGEARRIAQQIYPLILAGKDVRQMQFYAQTDQLKLKHFWQMQGRDYFANKYKRSQDAIRNIENWVLPHLGSVPLTKIDQRLVELRLVKRLRDNQNTLRIVISQLKSLLVLAVECGLIDVQPIGHVECGITPKVQLIDNSSVLSAAQLKGLYYRAGQQSKPCAALYCLRLQILTAQSLVTICHAYRQDINGNKWLLRSNNGKLSGKEIPIVGPLKPLVKEILKLFPKTRSLYLFPGRLRHVDAHALCNDWPMDSSALAKQQQRFICSVHNINITQTTLGKTIEQAMLTLNINPLAVAYLFNHTLAPSLTLHPQDPAIAEALALWHQG